MVNEVSLEGYKERRDPAQPVFEEKEQDHNGNKNFGKIPSFGWNVRMDHVFPESWNQKIRLRLKQIPDMLPLVIRYLIWWIRTWLIGRVKPYIDLYVLDGKQIYGVPIGGIGGGSIGRGFRGQFCRFHLTPGFYTYNVVPADQFIFSVRQVGRTTYQKVLTGDGDPGTLSSWDWSYNPADGTYHGLYPRAWYTYNIPEENLVLHCKQISPVLPNNYEDSSLPVAVFVWNIINQSSEVKDVSITFTFKSGIGSKMDKKKSCSTSSFALPRNGVLVHGVSMEHTIDGIPTTYGIGCLEKTDIAVTHMTSFDLKRGSDLWEKLYKTGRLDIESSCYQITKGEVGSAVNCSGHVLPNSSLEMIFSLVWDQPTFRFKGKEIEYTRRYCRYVSRIPARKEDTQGTAAVQNLLGLSLSRYYEWDRAIESWQNPVLDDEKLPSWFKSALFNELYFISDGGTFWVEYEPTTKYLEDGVRTEFGRFGYLEGHEYRMYNTYDVHFYASFALAMLWPNLQLALQYDFSDTIPLQDPHVRTHLFDGRRAQRKVKNTVPHDIGGPAHEPYKLLNEYITHDVSEWRDLNLKFVLQVYRDFKFTENNKFLNDMLPMCLIVMKKSMIWDTDGDGLIENSGSADQTYDSWIMKGPSAYCGGLWIASVFALIQMINESNIDSDEKISQLSYYQEVLEKGVKSYHEKLWTGDYYKFDSSPRKNGKSIMSDQLCGHWFLAMTGIDDDSVFPSSNVITALKTIYEKNVLGSCDGSMGAINGINPDGTIDTFALQSEETWTGVTYAVAATMIQKGMVLEGFKTAEGIYRTVYEKIGMGFETPEALLHTKKYRAIGYMRPLSIWAMWNAWKRLSPALKSQ